VLSIFALITLVSLISLSYYENKKANNRIYTVAAMLDIEESII
jgi:hypothetical protein